MDVPGVCGNSNGFITPDAGSAAPATGARRTTWRTFNIEFAAIRQVPSTESLLRPPIGAPAQIPEADAVRRRGETRIAHVRRLRQDHPHLGTEQLTQLTGVTRHHIRKDIALQSLTPAMREVLNRTPRRPYEATHDYARRIGRARPSLTPAQRDLIAFAGRPTLCTQLAAHALPESLSTIYRNTPPDKDENKIQYARRLHKAHPALSHEELAQLAGVSLANVRDDPVFHCWTPELITLREQTPRRAKETRTAYAQRLHTTDLTLDVRSIATLSGLNVNNARRAISAKRLTRESHVPPQAPLTANDMVQRSSPGTPSTDLAASSQVAPALSTAQSIQARHLREAAFCDTGGGTFANDLGNDWLSGWDDHFMEPEDAVEHDFPRDMCGASQIVPGRHL